MQHLDRFTGLIPELLFFKAGLISWLLRNEDFERYNKDLRGKIRHSILEEMAQKSRINFHGVFHFNPEYINPELAIKLVSDKEIDSLQISNGSKNWDRVKYYQCSMPVFDSKKRYAIVSFGGGGGRTSLNGKHYLFRKSKKTWVLVGVFGEWVT
jgi:hypothetical protein